MGKALQRHWPEYLMEAGGLAAFMISACIFGTLLGHPASLVHDAIESPFLRRVLMGLAMGGTAMAIVYSPWGKQSGAHLNPAVTLTFHLLGKVSRPDAIWYVLAQFLGGVVGVAVASLVLGEWLAHASVNWVVTLPGEFGAGVAWLGEIGISFILMTVILNVSNGSSLARFTGVFAGICVAAFITFEDPLSGMSMNPARTFGSAAFAGIGPWLWIYFTAPPAGMLVAAWVYGLFGRTACAKLHHQNSKRCIFCEFQMEQAATRAAVQGHRALDAETVRHGV